MKVQTKMSFVLIDDENRVIAIIQAEAHKDMTDKLLQAITEDTSAKQVNMEFMEDLIEDPYQPVDFSADIFDDEDYQYKANYQLISAAEY